LRDSLAKHGASRRALRPRSRRVSLLLRLQSGEELDRDELDRHEIVVRRIGDDAAGAIPLVAVIDEHLATVAPHPAGTTDRLLEADRLRPH